MQGRDVGESGAGMRTTSSLGEMRPYQPVQLPLYASDEVKSNDL
jgi:hypothetical protein